MSDKHKGMIFRATRSAWAYADGSIGTTTRLKVLKRLSCDPEECPHCAGVMEFIAESLLNDIEFVNFNCEQGKAYKLHQCTSTDWETGHVEIDALEFKEVDLT